MLAYRRSYGFPLLLAQVPLLLVPLLVLGLRLEDERTRVRAQLDVHAQSTMLALANYLQAVEGHLRLLSLRLPEDGGAPAAFLREAQAVQRVTGVDAIRLSAQTGDTMLQVRTASPTPAPMGVQEPPFLVMVRVERQGARQELAAHLLPRNLLAVVEPVGVPSGWNVRIVSPDGRVVDRGSLKPAAGSALARVRYLPIAGWRTEVSAPTSAVYASLWQSAGRELLLLVLAVVLLPPLAWRLLRSARQVSGSPDSDLQHQMLIQVEERQQAMARELHDSVGSSLSGIAMLLSTAQHMTERAGYLRILDTAQQQVAESVQQVRQISRGMMPVGTEAGGLLSALVQLAAEISSIEDVRCTVLARGTFDDVPATHGTHLFRIVQEATGNALRHGQARRIRILLARAGGCCRLSVMDDGRGCTPQKILGRSGGLGMRSIRSRAKAIGGSLEVLAQRGRGVRLRVAWLAPADWID